MAVLTSFNQVQKHKNTYGELPSLVQVSQFAEFLGVKDQTIRDMIHRGELPASKIGKRFYVNRDAFIDMVNAGMFEVRHG